MSALDLTEAVETAARASYEDWRQGPNVQGPSLVWEDAPAMLRVNITEALLPIVAAAAVVLEQRLRVSIAAEIEASLTTPTDISHIVWNSASRDAARIVRGVVS